MDLESELGLESELVLYQNQRMILNRMTLNWMIRNQMILNRMIPNRMILTDDMLHVRCSVRPEARLWQNIL